jgi:hypothetical protein
MIYSAGDLGVQIDYQNDQPVAVLQRLEGDYWEDWPEQPVHGELDINSLAHGQYRFVLKPAGTV